ncbi:MAG: hypothetical protein GY787_22590 [Alteromonadales bacterium]|nr:hypothetical protein [Alteromonadales bacterium]
MNLFLLAQYVTVTMVVTITIDLFTLKPVVEQKGVISTQVTNVTLNDQ